MTTKPKDTDSEKSNDDFLKLTPYLDDENLDDGNHDTYYKSALDFAFNDREIKNIALTGPYGSGKTTIWARYVKQKEADDEAFKNIISVALGKYDCALNTSDKVADKDNPDKLSQAEENRLEKQLIQQIAAQIPSKKIPLSKFRFKEEKNKDQIKTFTRHTLFFILSIILWFNKDFLLANTDKLLQSQSACISLIFILILLFAFLFPLYYFIGFCFKHYQFRLTKITFQGAEASAKEDDFKESVFDQELKEIVYLLKQSGAKIIVFEDIDRYDDLSLFTKLRELNFILNKNLEASGKAYTVRFIYLLKDSLLESKTRTKFFDFIMPVIPVVTAHNSEDKLIELLKNENDLDERFIIAVSNVSLYIDDMRLLKNIVNEFKLYKDLINLNLKEEAHNKLFSILLIKNIFPYEFDALQAERGYFKTLFHTIEQHKKTYQKEKYALLEKEQKNRILNNLKTWANDNANRKVKQDDSVSYQNKFYKINYTDYQLETTEDIIDLSDRSILGREKVDDLKTTLAEKKKEIEKLSSLSAKDFLALEDLSEERKVTLFKESGENIFQHHYFGLVRYLVVSGYFSESYAYYMNHLYTDALSAKDRHYLKNILEARPQSALAPLDNPEKVFDHLESKDLKRFNTLNKMLIEYIVGLEKPQDETKESKETKEARENKESIITEMLLASSGEQLVEYLYDFFKDHSQNPRLKNLLFNTPNITLIEYIVGLEELQAETKGSIISEMLLASSDEQLVEYLYDISKDHSQNSRLRDLLNNYFKEFYSSSKNLSKEQLKWLLKLGSVCSKDESLQRLKAILIYLIGLSEADSKPALINLIKSLIEEKINSKILSIYMKTVDELRDLSSFGSNTRPKIIKDSYNYTINNDRKEIAKSLVDYGYASTHGDEKIALNRIVS